MSDCQTWRRPSKADERDHDLPPLKFECRWRFGPGSFCGTLVARPETLCETHEAAQADRVAAILAAKEATAE